MMGVFRVSGFGFRGLPQPRQPETRNQESETQDRNPEARNQKPGARDQKPETRNAIRVLAGFLLVAAVAAAREPDGTFSIIRTPNNGIPVIVLPGDTFEATLTQQAALSLVAENASPGLTVEWTKLPGGATKAHCTVAADAQPGTYAIEAKTEDRTDRIPRSVFVVASFPDTYIVAQLTDTHVGGDRNGRSASDIFRDAIKAVNESQAAFAVITGDLTHDGDLTQFQQFLDILDTAFIPTFVCAGNHDRQGLNYERVFGPTVYMFRFSRDGYLCFDTKDFIPADELSGQDTELEIFRRAIKPSRWSVGVTHRYEPFMAMRGQLVLFVDDPLDYLIFGHWHRANTDKEKAVPWGRTPITVTPATVDGYIRLFDVSGKGVKGREPQKVAATE